MPYSRASTAILPAPLSVDAFLRRPERTDVFQEELLEAGVFLSPNVKPRHNEVVRRLESSLRPLEEAGFVIQREVACRLDEYSLPNTGLCVIRREVHSPGNRYLHHKAALYLQYGAEQVWIVHPKARRIATIRGRNLHRGSRR